MQTTGLHKVCLFYFSLFTADDDRLIPLEPLPNFINTFVEKKAWHNHAWHDEFISSLNAHNKI